MDEIELASTEDEERLAGLAASLKRSYRNGDRAGAANAARMFLEILLDNGWKYKGKRPNSARERDEFLVEGVRHVLSGLDH